MPQMPEVVETNGNGAAAPIERRVQIHAQDCDRALLRRARDAL